MHSLKNNRCYFSFYRPFFRRCYNDILRTHNCINHCTMLNIIHTCKLRTTKTHPEFSRHNAAKNVAFPDKIGNKGIFRFIVDILRRTGLLDFPFRHHDNLIGHCERLFLIMRHINKCNSQLLMHAFKLQLHLLTHL